MSTFELNRRQALVVGGMAALSLGMPGMVMGTDKLDASGKAVAAEKSCIFVLLCGGPSHIDTWDMKPDAPDTIRGPYKPIATKVPGMRINEMHTRAGEADRPVHAHQLDDASGRASAITSTRCTTCSAANRPSACRRA